MIQLEIACNSWNSCLNAEAGGADRIELFENLADGGCTPSAGMIILSTMLSIPVYVMIRPRGGDFCYTRDEIEIMKTDIDVCKTAGVKGIVFGCLTADGKVDTELCRELLQHWRGPATFHRAIDECLDLRAAFETVASLGFERILSSGGEATAEAGMHNLQELQREFGHKIKIMPGSGIHLYNAQTILNTTGCTELHATCKVEVSSKTSGTRGMFSTRTESSLELIKDLKARISA